MLDFCNKLRDIILEQKEDVVSAINNRGPYVLAPEYESFLVPQETWFKMTTAQRESHIRRFLDKSIGEEESRAGEAVNEMGNKLSVRLDKFQLPAIPSVILGEIVLKAENLLSNPW